MLKQQKGKFQKAEGMLQSLRKEERKKVVMKGDMNTKISDENKDEEAGKCEVHGRNENGERLEDDRDERELLLPNNSSAHDAAQIYIVTDYTAVDNRLKVMQKMLGWLQPFSLYVLN